MEHSHLIHQSLDKGIIQDIRRFIREESFDVNMDVGQDGKKGRSHIQERPLFVALSKVKTEGDDYYKIAQALLRHPNIQVNMPCGGDGSQTILGLLCETRSESLAGVKLLLDDVRVDVNGGFLSTPLYAALKSIKSEGDHFHEIARLLLQRRDTDPNANCSFGSAIGLICKDLHVSSSK